MMAIVALGSGALTEDARAELRVRGHCSDSQILIEGDETTGIRRDERLPVYSRRTGELLGFAEAKYRRKRGGPAGPRSPAQRIQYDVVATLITMTSTKQILPGDRLKRVNLEYQSPDYVGNTNLLQTGKKRYSSRYKPLVSMGPIGDTAATLDSHENFVSIVGGYGRGLTDDLMVSTNVFMSAVLPSVDVKYRLLNHKDMSIAVAAKPVFYSPRVSASGGLEFGELVGSAFVDLPSGSKLISHTAFSFTTGGLFTRSSGSLSRIETSFQTGYEYIRDGWDRVLLGPRYNFDARAVGGYLAYIFVWDSFHLQLGMHVTNAGRLELSANDGYLPYGYLFWRF